MTVPCHGRNRLITGAVCLALLVLPGCKGCRPVTLKTIELPARSAPTGLSGTSGSQGFCFSAGNPPPTPFSAGAGQILVGFDDYFKAGTDPFPCDDVRNAIFRGGLLFDVSQFDSIVSASLLFAAASSVERVGGESIGTIPGKSFATTLGIATQTFSSPMADNNHAPLGSGPNLDIGVTSQVKDWIANTRPNFGFVIGGPRFAGGVFEDNDAQLTWYQNFRLRVVYNPAQNPRAPQ